MRFFLFIIFAVSATAQSVGDFSINYKANSTGPQSLKTWAKSNSTLWGTNSSGNPQSITLGTGLSLTSGVLSATGGSFDPQSANQVFAGPTTGSAATPTFRALVAGDIPSLSAVYQPKNGNLDTLAAGLGASIGQRVVAWDGSSYALLSGALSVAYGGTSFSSYTPGDILYYGASSMQKLAGNTTATKKFLTQTGTGSASADPAWGTIQGSDITFTDVTTGNATTSNHGYLRKLSGTSTQYLDGSGSWSTPASGATLAANTFTGAQTYSVNGAASTPAISITGTLFTGGTTTSTKPLFLVEPAGTTSTGWSIYGTYLGVNAASGFANGSLIDLQIGGTSYFKVVPNFGAVELYLTENHRFLAYNKVFSPNYSTIALGESGDSNHQWDGLAIKESSAVSWSNDAFLYRDDAGIIAQRNLTSAQEFRVYGTTTGSKYASFKHDGTDAVISASSGNVKIDRGGVLKTTIGANTTDHTQPIKLPSYIVSGLPSASTCGAGSMAFVTDATLTTAYTTVIGSGSNKVLVISDGTNWVIH